ncbi:MAG: ATPase, T2SS/T4P/T4SS family [Candidatus Omnitrophota bacterium]
MLAKTIVIFSTKGGVGKTLVATNLAVSLGYYLRKKVALVDLDLQATGDMPMWLDITANKCLLDLAEKLKNNPQDENALQEHLFSIERYEISFLPAVLKPHHVGRIDSNKINTVLDAIEQAYDYIIIDAGRAFTETLFSVFNHANLILLVSTPDILSVYQTKWALDILQSLHIPLNLIKIVLNRAQSLGGVSWQEVRAAVPCEIIGRIPSEGKAIGLALNRRIPIVIDNPNCRASAAIKKLGIDLTSGKENYFLERQQVDAASAAPKIEEGILLKEDDFWANFKFGQGPSAVEGQDKESDEVIELKKRVHQKLIDKLDLKHLEIDVSDPIKAAQVRERTEKTITNALAEESGMFLASLEVRKKLVKEIADEALGLGPLEDLVNDESISDIMVNNKNQIYIERQGKIELSPKRFLSNEQVRQVIERIIAPLGRRIDESVPMVDSRLPDGSRVNAIIPPLALTGPTLTIRKFGRERLNMNDLLRLNTLTKPMADFINACVVSRKNIIVSGGTGSGKTTVLNVLSAFIPETERIITIEDAAEIRLKQEHWVRLESRPPNIEGKGAITTRELFRNSLRMRPDRIVIGECRGAETLDMLQAMNTGHDGSMTTIHANSTHDVISRMDSMILMSGAELPVRAIREMIASAIHIIIHTARLSDGSRKVLQISEMTGMLDEMHIGSKDIFNFKQSGVSLEGKVLGQFTPTGYIPSFMQDLIIRGIKISEDIFKPVA